MLHLKPIQEEKAEESLQKLYKDVRQTLNVEIVPLIFQYLANFEEYFEYAWEKWRKNIQSSQFKEFEDEVIKFSHEAIEEIYKPSEKTLDFVSQLNPVEKENIQKSIEQIEKVNAVLFLLTVGLREGLKGVMVGQKFLAKEIQEVEFTGIFDEYINAKNVRSSLQSTKNEIEPESKILAPLFGQKSIIVSNYPGFFSHVAKEMETLLKTEKYLEQRVVLEHIGLLSISRFPYDLGCTYKEISQFAYKKPYFGELVYILSETFPSTFPHLVLTSALMQSLLNPHNQSSLSVANK